MKIRNKMKEKKIFYKNQLDDIKNFLNDYQKEYYAIRSK